jgi:type I restriction-modification system DNA methylase subunit
MFDIVKNSTYKKLTNKLNNLDLSQIDYDSLGDAYEEITRSVMMNEELKQFFTPP